MDGALTVGRRRRGDGRPLPELDLVVACTQFGHDAGAAGEEGVVPCARVPPLVYPPPAPSGAAPSGFDFDAPFPRTN